MATLSPALISANGLALAYGAAPLLEEVTLSVAPGEKVGLVGRNGCGKTSLLKILAGEGTADAGEISRRRGFRIGYLPQEFDLAGDRTGRRTCWTGLRGTRPVPAATTNWRNYYTRLRAQTAGTCPRGSTPARPPWTHRRWMRSSARFPAARNGGWHYAGRWRRNRTCCCWTSRPIISTRNRSAGSKSFSHGFPGRGFS